MAIVTIMCPQTGKQVSTGVEMDRTGFNALSYSRRFVFHCWLCGREHVWSKRWASLAEKSEQVLSGVLDHSGTEIRSKSRPAPAI
jgi:hypothetical protein